MNMCHAQLKQEVKSTGWIQFIYKTQGKKKNSGKTWTEQPVHTNKIRQWTEKNTGFIYKSKQIKETRHKGDTTQSINQWKTMATS